MDATIKEIIESILAEHNVVLFMKGSTDFPQCGFSGLVVSVLQKLEVDFHDINVLEDNNIREGIKKFADWPTIPQLYIKGEFIGGCDIIKEMYQSGELQELLKDQGVI